MSHCHPVNPCSVFGTSTGIILVLYILLVIILRTCWF
ncbi:YjcZ family sporulation protein [Paenibacillus sp. SEL1]|uniref:YjcZ family sporulation protein n=1 Tax=Paenibacillus polymyxa TaxID=1406 RepID=A0AAE9L8S7_PAEPO|nr:MULTISPECIES: YjcZ family sporulation protein [Paenibacillus]MDY7991912.1 YjcZ family sporulation protein [Paenibacillus polymyxa]MDY8046891.1 YjcZ family sporulation protein [Paenibacillus polymyxa]MDY8118239.1 YjcZ family sporulation protein [Paenibacillus polymyxa]URJ50388.1 YjcZ family sporulation protein [Paenibacillus polymyxa]URJ59502.1 YjcZ family sporulation protein [Paenibacillus polymyxa]